jgi:hypothetical protein
MKNYQKVLRLYNVHHPVAWIPKKDIAHRGQEVLQVLHGLEACVVALPRLILLSTHQDPP